MLYVSHTGCQRRFLPESLEPWTRVWSQLRRGSRSGTSVRALTVLHRGGPYGRTRGAKRIVAVDVTGLPVGALVVPRLYPRERDDRGDVGAPHRARSLRPAGPGLLVDRGGTAAADALGRRHDLEVRRVGWDDRQTVSRPIWHAWRVEVAHGRLGRSLRLAKSCENTTISATGWLQVACVATTLRQLSPAQAPARTPSRSVTARNAAACCIASRTGARPGFGPGARPIALNAAAHASSCGSHLACVGRASPGRGEAQERFALLEAALPSRLDDQLRIEQGGRTWAVSWSQWIHTSAQQRSR